MRVNDLNLTGASAPETGRTQGSQAVERDTSSRSSAARGNSGGDKVEFSPLSHVLQASASSRSARVDQLTAQYRAGQYQVDAARVGKAMVSEAITSSAAKLS